MPRSKSLVTFARLISWAGHPLVFVTVSVAIVVATQVTSRVAWPILATLLFSVVIPTAILLAVGVRSGRWQDADVSVPEERKQFYPRAIPISAVGAIVAWYIGAPPFIIRGTLVTLGLFIIAAIINTRLKISLHSIFASYCATILFRIGIGYGVAGLVLAVLVFWSRLFLGRHNTTEVSAGIVLGVCGGIVAAWWPG